MLKTGLLHPEILRALAAAGHGVRVLVADGNYPVSTESPPSAEKVFLNLRRGLVGTVDVLDALAQCIPIESAIVMEDPDSQTVPLHERYRQMLPAIVSLTGLKRVEFYQEAKSAATTLVIATAEEERFANILLTIGVSKSSH